jgi:hypothetical protein
MFFKQGNYTCHVCRPVVLKRRWYHCFASRFRNYVSGGKVGRSGMPKLALFNEMIRIYHEMRLRLHEMRKPKGQGRRARF